ncbi:ComEA family DNA-binding protein [Congregibacter sp.]|uniref:ComEA family DNA-binding protein n=1 Tax=Congregibacter sp. TaxID=2744308 RepID=UPI003F6D70DB
MTDIKTYRSTISYIPRQITRRYRAQGANLPSVKTDMGGQTKPPFRRCPSTARKVTLAAAAALVAQLMVQASPTLAQELASKDSASLAAGVVGQDKAQDMASGVDINTASASELASQLNGIGGSKAEAIVRYREQFGPFESVDELSEVTGIGASTVERNRTLIRIR